MEIARCRLMTSFCLMLSFYNCAMAESSMRKIFRAPMDEVKLAHTSA